MNASFLVIELGHEEWAISGENVEQVAAEGDAEMDMVDLRSRFGFAPASSRDCIVVVRVGGRRVGFVVDAVRDLVELREADVEPPPDLGGAVMPRWLRGLIRYDDRLALVLDAGELLPCSA